MLREKIRICAASCGVHIAVRSRDHAEHVERDLLDRLHSLRLSELVESGHSENGRRVAVALRPAAAERLIPDGDTLRIHSVLNLDSRGSTDDLEREILLAMLASPVPFRFPSLAEFQSAVRMRIAIVQAARKTRLQFETQTAARPPEYWRYDEDRGFVLLPGRSLADGLREALHPTHPEERYSFSCWRATEHVGLLAIAQETARHNAELHRQICRQSELRALKAAAFERVYLRDHGSAKQPLPPRYFVPGDRTWFRNPDPASADVAGFEGSFTFYLGAGEFANFFRDCVPFTMTTKCLTIYHWRNGLFRDAQGETQVDENRVDELIARTLRDPVATERIVREMARWQSHPECFDGGMIEPHRKVPPLVCRDTADIQLPDVMPAIERVRANRATASA